MNLGEKYGTAQAVAIIRSAIKAGTLSTTETFIRGAERLDTLAGSIYGDSRYWWILAACSDIGWGMQLPAGTIIRVPEISAIASLVT